MRPLLVALMLALSAIAFLPSAEAAACSTDVNPTDDDGVSASCSVPNTPYRCSVGGLAYGDPTPRASCSPGPIVCVREPCP